MKPKKRKRKIIILSIVLTILSIICIVVPIVDKTGVRHLATNAFLSMFTNKCNDEVSTVFKKTDGWMTGVCTSIDKINNQNLNFINEANISWVRVDLWDLPYDLSTKEIKPTYYDFKNFLNQCKSKKIKCMVVTPYPKTYYQNGCDVRTTDGKEQLKEISEFLIKDLQEYAGAIQVSNELGMERFRMLNDFEQLSLNEATEFIGIQLEAMNKYKNNTLIGYNLSGLNTYLFMKEMKQYEQYCDYIGIDIYCGCFEPFLREGFFFDLILNAVWNYSHKPIILTEFGYIGGGSAKDDTELKKVLNSYGYENEKQAKADIQNLFSKLPERLQKNINSSNPKNNKDLKKLIFNSDYTDHFYCQIPTKNKMRKYSHDAQGQATFFKDIIKRIGNLDFVCGAFVYNLTDNNMCYICGQEDCPVETMWGILDKNGNKKPSYYTVSEAFKDVLEQKSKKFNY